MCGMDLQKPMPIPVELARNADAISLNGNVIEMFPRAPHDLRAYETPLARAIWMFSVNLFQLQVDRAQAIPGSRRLDYHSCCLHTKPISPPTVDPQALP